MADFPFCPKSIGELAQGMDMKLVAVTVKKLRGSPESSTRTGELCLA